MAIHTVCKLALVTGLDRASFSLWEIQLTNVAESTHASVYALVLYSLSVKHHLCQHLKVTNIIQVYNCRLSFFSPDHLLRSYT